MVCRQGTRHDVFNVAGQGYIVKMEVFCFLSVCSSPFPLGLRVLAAADPPSPELSMTLVAGCARRAPTEVTAVTGRTVRSG